MSMISSKCDELRDWACELRKLANGPVNEGFPAREKLFESADAMCQAADTILELRDDLRQANESTEDAEHDESMAWDRVRKAEAENVKLRSTLKAIIVGTNAELCADRDAPQCRECSMHHNDGECAIVDAMELLGIDMYGEPLGIEVEE